MKELNTLNIRNFRMFKSKQSETIFEEASRFGFNETILKEQEWHKGYEVVGGIHPFKGYYQAWYYTDEGKFNFNSFYDKEMANDWVLSKSIRYLRVKKMRLQFLLYKVTAIVIVIALCTLYWVTKIFN